MLEQAVEIAFFAHKFYRAARRQLGIFACELVFFYRGQYDGKLHQLFFDFGALEHQLAVAFFQLRAESALYERGGALFHNGHKFGHGAVDEFVFVIVKSIFHIAGVAHAGYHALRAHAVANVAPFAHGGIRFFKSLRRLELFDRGEIIFFERLYVGAHVL